MISLVLQWISYIAISLGLLFLFIGTLGLLRFPDFFSRIHAIGKSDTLGAMLMLGGLALLYVVEHDLSGAAILTALKIMGIVAFIFLANPTATHAFARAALRSGLKPWTVGETEDLVPGQHDVRQVPPDHRWVAVQKKRESAS